MERTTEWGKQENNIMQINGYKKLMNGQVSKPFEDAAVYHAAITNLSNWLFLVGNDIFPHLHNYSPAVPFYVCLFIFCCSIINQSSIFRKKKIPRRVYRRPWASLVYLLVSRLDFLHFNKSWESGVTASTWPFTISFASL